MTALTSVPQDHVGLIKGLHIGFQPRALLPEEPRLRHEYIENVFLVLFPIKDSVKLLCNYVQI